MCWPRWPRPTPAPTPACRRSPRPTTQPPGWTATATAPFKSATKWSGVSYGDHGNWVIGAPDVLLDPASAAAEQAERIGAQGLRVLLLGSARRAPWIDPDAPGRVTPAALVVLEQTGAPRRPRDTGLLCRAGCFGEGDLRRQRGVGRRGGRRARPARRDAWTPANCPTDPAELADALDAYTTFGRVRPDQKRAMVHALQSRGHTVAMTGDGVNDVLALKDADIGVAMGAGSPASRAVAQIVLLDNRFATLPYVVAEGRRVIGNIERVANLFLTKTVYSVLLALLVGIAVLVVQAVRGRPAAVPVPADPRHHRGVVHHRHPGVHPVAGTRTTNAPTPGFVRRVMTSALPSGLIVGVATFVSYLLAYQGRARHRGSSRSRPPPRR